MWLKAINKRWMVSSPTVRSLIQQVWETKTSHSFTLFRPSVWSNSVSGTWRLLSWVVLVYEVWVFVGGASCFFQPLWLPLLMLIVVLALYISNHCYCGWKHKVHHFVHDRAPQTGCLEPQIWKLSSKRERRAIIDMQMLQIVVLIGWLTILYTLLYPENYG